YLVGNGRLAFELALGIRAPTTRRLLRAYVAARDDYPMTSLSDGLGPQKDPNSGRTRVESGPAGTHRPTTRRGSAIGASRGVPRARRAQAGDVDVGPSPSTPGTSTPGRRRPSRGCGPA